MSAGTGVPSLEMIRVLPSLAGEVEGAGGGLGEGFGALLATTLAQVCWRGDGVVFAAPVSAAGGGGILMFLRREPIFSSATLGVRVGIFYT